MPQHNPLSTNQEADLRAKQIKATIRKLKRKVQKISEEGEVAPPHCHVIRYQTKKNEKIYWYYKLQAAEPIFPTATDKNKKSKYLGFAEKVIDQIMLSTANNLRLKS